MGFVERVGFAFVVTSLCGETASAGLTLPVAELVRQEIGDAQAQISMCRDHLAGVEVGATKNGDAYAQLELASVNCADSADLAKCIERLQEAADLGNIDAAFELGTLYESGLNVKMSRMLAKHWFHVAAKGGRIEAQERLAGMYENGPGGLDCDNATKWHGIAAKNGSASSLRWLELNSVHGNCASEAE